MTGEALRAAREALGWSQAHLANKMGVSPRTIRLWEAAKVPRSRVAFLGRVLRLEVDVSEPQVIPTDIKHLLERHALLLEIMGEETKHLLERHVLLLETMSEETDRLIRSITADQEG